jgi:hypothetical protein
MSPDVSPPRPSLDNPATVTTLLLTAGRNPEMEAYRPRDLYFRLRSETRHVLSATILCSRTNLLLLCVPLGLMGTGWGWPASVVFLLNFLAMLPLASILTFATEQLAAVVGSVAGGLINVTFGNAVEMIVGISVQYIRPLVPNNTGI